MRYILAALVAMATVAEGATIRFALTNFNLTTPSNVIQVFQTRPVNNGQNIAIGQPLRLQPSAGVVTTNLNAGHYELKVQGLTLSTNLYFHVPDNSETYDVASLITNGTYQATATLPFVTSVTATNTTNTAGLVTVYPATHKGNVVLAIGTNITSAGEVTLAQLAAATNGHALLTDLNAATNGHALLADLNAATNGLVTSAQLSAATNGHALLSDVNAATNGLPTAADLAASTNGLPRMADINAATNGLPTAADVAAKAGTNDLAAATNGLATAASVAVKLDTNTAASTYYPLLSNPSNYIARSGDAGDTGAITLTNQAGEILTITMAEGVGSNATVTLPSAAEVTAAQLASATNLAQAAATNSAKSYTDAQVAVGLTNNETREVTFQNGVTVSNLTVTGTGTNLFGYSQFTNVADGSWLYQIDGTVIASNPPAAEVAMADLQSATNLLLSTANTWSVAQYSSASSTNAPSDNEFVVADWVRHLLVNGYVLYNSTNLAPGLVYGLQPNLYQSTIPIQFSRVYGGVTNNQYVGAVAISTNATSVSGPIVVSVYLSFNAGGGRAVSVKPEIYYSYDDGTNLLGDWDCQAQAIAGGVTNRYDFVVSIPTTTFTNAASIYRVLKVVSQVANPNVVVSGGTNSPSQISYGVAASTDSVTAAQLQSATNTSNLKAAGSNIVGAVSSATGATYATNYAGTTLGVGGAATEPMTVLFTDNTGAKTGFLLKNEGTVDDKAYAGIAIHADNGTVQGDFTIVPPTGTALSGGGALFRTVTDHKIGFSVHDTLRAKLETAGLTVYGDLTASAITATNGINSTASNYLGAVYGALGSPTTSSNAFTVNAGTDKLFYLTNTITLTNSASWPAAGSVAFASWAIKGASTNCSLGVNTNWIGFGVYSTNNTTITSNKWYSLAFKFNGPGETNVFWAIQPQQQ